MNWYYLNTVYALNLTSWATSVKNDGVYSSYNVLHICE
jgi:hypothetical protein